MLRRVCLLLCLLSPLAAAQVDVEVIERYQQLHRWLAEDPAAQLAPIVRFYQKQKGQSEANRRVATGLYLQACLQFQQYACGRDRALELLDFKPEIQEQSQLLKLAIQLAFQTEQYSQVLALGQRWQTHLESEFWQPARQAFPTLDSQAEVETISAYSAYQLKLWQQAERSISSAIDKNPTQERYQLLLTIYQQAEALVEENQLLRKVTQLYPLQEKYWLRLAQSYLSQNQTEQAIAVFSSLDDRNLLAGTNVLLLAQLMIAQNTPVAAAQLLSKHQAQLLRSEGYPPLMLKALLLSRQRKKALSFLEQHPQIKLLATQAQLAYGQGEWQKAIILLTKQMALDPTNDYWRLLRGISYFELQQYTQAKIDFVSLSDSEYQAVVSQWQQQVHYLSEPVG